MGEAAAAGSAGPIGLAIGGGILVVVGIWWLFKKIRHEADCASAKKLLNEINRLREAALAGDTEACKKANDKVDEWNNKNYGALECDDLTTPVKKDCP